LTQIYENEKHLIDIFFLVLTNFVNAQGRKKDRKSVFLAKDSIALIKSYQFNKKTKNVARIEKQMHNGKLYLVEHIYDSTGKGSIPEQVIVWEIVRCVPSTYRKKMVGQPILGNAAARRQSNKNYVLQAISENQ
jgi:hypothetical protein